MTMALTILFFIAAAVVIWRYLWLNLRLSQMDVPDAERTHPPFRTVAAFNRWWERSSQSERDRFMRRAGLLLAIPLLSLAAIGCHQHHHYPLPKPPAPTPEPAPVEEVPGILGPDSVAPGSPLWLSANVEDESTLIWRVEHPQDLPFRVTDNGKEFSSAGPMDANEVRVALYVARKVADGVEAKLVTRTVQVGKSPNPPPGPDPPKPPVPPTPPEPPPEPAPIPAKGLHVVIVYESGDTLSKDHQAILYGEEVRGYLDTKTQLYTDKSRAYRIYDADVDVSEDWPVWQEAMKRPRESVPWVIVSNGETGFEGPLPESPEAFLELLKKYEVTK